MKDIVLIGDSIRMGYQSTVHRELQGFATIWGPSENGRTSQNVLDHLDEWVLLTDPDIVHVNAGIHDITRDLDSTIIRVTLDQYSQNVREILRTIQEKTQSRLIWATTTPVIGPRADALNIRRTEDVLAYNDAAVGVAQALGVEIDDLYGVAMQAGLNEILTPDGVHFTDQGSNLLGKAVADFIRGKS
jgi:lysophospholipase L1-like esterase